MIILVWTQNGKIEGCELYTDPSVAALREKTLRSIRAKGTPIDNLRLFSFPVELQEDLLLIGEALDSDTEVEPVRPSGAICEWCQKYMDHPQTVTCAGNTIVEFPDGTNLPAVPFESPEGERCEDCGVATGGYHHPGCEEELCPKCGRQLITCGCLREKDK